MSLVMAGDFVVIPTRRPGTRSTLSSTFRVTPKHGGGWARSEEPPERRVALASQFLKWRLAAWRRVSLSLGGVGCQAQRYALRPG